MQALGIVLPEGLPVAGDLRFPVMAGDEARHRPVVERRETHVGGEFARFRIKVQKQEAIPLAAGDALQAMGGAVEVGRRHGMAGGHQRAVGGGKGKGVIGAADQLAERLLRGAAEFRPAVRAAVVEGGNAAVGAAGHDDGGGTYLDPAHAPGREVGKPPGHHPLPGKHRFHFALEPAGIDVGLAREPLRAAVEARRKRVAFQSHSGLPGSFSCHTADRTSAACHLTD